MEIRLTRQGVWGHKSAARRAMLHKLQAPKLVLQRFAGMLSPHQLRLKFDKKTESDYANCGSLQVCPQLTRRNRLKKGIQRRRCYAKAKAER